MAIFFFVDKISNVTMFLKIMQKGSWGSNFVEISHIKLSSQGGVTEKSGSKTFTISPFDPPSFPIFDT